MNGQPPRSLAPDPNSESHEMASQQTQNPSDNPSSAPSPLSEESKVHLQEWENEKKEELGSVELYRTRCNTVKTELYQLLGFYSVFQGVVFSAVATSDKLKCQTSLLPALLSLLTSIATAFSVHYKLTSYSTEKEKFIKSMHHAENMITKIRALKTEKDNFDFTKDYMATPALDLKLEQRTGAETKSLRWFYAAVMLFLAIFSLIILACCVLILCWDLDQGKLMLCAFTQCWEKPITVHIHTQAN